MMLADRIQVDLSEAMRSRDTVRVRTLRSVRAAIQQKEIEDRSGTSAAVADADVVALIQKQAKQRRDSIEQFQSAGRQDLVAIEEQELRVLEEYLPQQMDDDEIRNIVTNIIQEVGAESISDIGKVMGPSMGKLRGKADGRRINEIVRDLLSQNLK